MYHYNRLESNRNTKYKADIFSKRFCGSFNVISIITTKTAVINTKSEFLLLSSPYIFQIKRGKSTGNAMHTLYSEIVHFMEVGESPAGVFCDLSRAFDCVNQDLLLDKLSYYGFKDTAFQWIESFIRERKHYVSIDHVQFSSRVNIKSECPSSIQMGVPQGSVLGSVLFILYVNKLPRVLPDVSFTAFADDTSLKCQKRMIRYCRKR